MFIITYNMAQQLQFYTFQGILVNLNESFYTNEQKINFILLKYMFSGHIL